MAARPTSITLTIGRSSEGPRSTGDLSILGLGFALYQIWLYMAVFSAPKTFNPGLQQLVSAGLPCTYHCLLVYSYLASSAIVLIIFAVLSKRITDFFYLKRSLLITTGLMLLGTLMLFLSIESVFTVFVSAILMGAGTAMLVILFGIVFASFDFATCVLNAGFAFAIGFIGADALINWVPSPFSGISACLMPVLMMGLFIRNQPPARLETKGEIPLRYVRPYIVREIISMAFLGIIIGAFRIICGDMLLSSGDVSMELLLGFGCMCMVAILVLAIALSKRAERWDSLLRNVTPAIIFGIAGIAFLTSGMQMFAAFFAVIGFALLISVTWILLSGFAHNLNGSSVFVFGLGYGVIQATSVVGVVLAYHFSLEGASLYALNPDISAEVADFITQLGLSHLSIVLMFLFSIGYILIPRYRELKEAFASLVLALAKESEPAADNVQDESDPLLSKEAIPSNSAHEETDETNDDALPGVPSVAADQDEASSEKESSIVSDGKANDSQTSVDQKGSFMRRCDEICSTYSLSAREQEAFFLLAKGHNAAFLTEKLCISRSTAKTHINHIYKKLGIHTQQELLNMVEDRQRGPIGAKVDRETLQDAIRRAKEEGPLESSPSELVKHISRDIL